MPASVSSTRSYGFENRTPRNRTTASQNHSGSAIDRATKVGEVVHALGRHEARDVARAQQLGVGAPHDGVSGHRPEIYPWTAEPVACAAW